MTKNIKNLSSNKSAQNMRKWRLYKRIKNLLVNNDCLFITFTFNNKQLKNTAETRKRYIKAYLNQETEQYILNIDYGTKTEREHYHAIAKPKKRNYINYKNYKYGLIKARIIDIKNERVNHNKTLNELINDFLKHSTKETTKNNKIIYSRINKTN